MKYEPNCGDTIDNAADELVRMFAESGEEATASFNEIPLVAKAGVTAGDIVAGYHAELERRHQAYVSTPEHKARQEAARIAHEEKKRRLAELLEQAPAAMSLRDPEAWAKSVAVNTDGYGGAVMMFAERWARLMEAKIAAGVPLLSCAKDMSSLADEEGITGFMYGCAVSILSKVWTHGEELRRWHNLDTQIGTEGEKANDSGGVLNPAIITVGE